MSSLSLCGIFLQRINVACYTGCCTSYSSSSSSSSSSGSSNSSSKWYFSVVRAQNGTWKALCCQLLKYKLKNAI